MATPRLVPASHYSVAISGRDSLAAAAGRDSLYVAWRYARALQMEYADKLRPAVAKYAADLVVVMRVYFEKPRTNVGWKVRG